MVGHNIGPEPSLWLDAGVGVEDLSRVRVLQLVDLVQFAEDGVGHGGPSARGREVRTDECVAVWPLLDLTALAWSDGREFDSVATNGGYRLSASSEALRGQKCRYTSRRKTSGRRKSCSASPPPSARLPNMKSPRARAYGPSVELLTIDHVAEENIPPPPPLPPESPEPPPEDAPPEKRGPPISAKLSAFKSLDAEAARCARCRIRYSKTSPR